MSWSVYPWVNEQTDPQKNRYTGPIFRGHPPLTGVIGEFMQNARTLALHSAGQRLWLDNLSRALLQTGTLAHYVQDLSVTGLTSNVGLFAQSVTSTTLYDASIGVLQGAGLSGNALLLELALEDFTQAAEWLRPIYDTTDGIDGWVSLEAAPSLAHDAQGIIDAAARLHAQAALSNLMIKIPGTAAGIIAAEASVTAGIPVYVTHLYSPDQVLSAGQGYMRALEERAALGLDLKVGSVAALVINRWDAVAPKNTSPPLRNRLGIAVAERTYQVYREALRSPRWCKLKALGARPQKLLWTGTSTGNPAGSDTLYVDALVAADTIQAIAETTLLAFADHGHVLEPLYGEETGEAEEIMAAYRSEGLNENAMATRLQSDDVAMLINTWRDLLTRVLDQSSLSPKVESVS